MANFFKKTGQWQRQGQMLTSALNVAVTDVDRKEVLTELGEVLEKHMGEVEQGLSFYRRALDVDPLHLPALEALERICNGSRSVERSRRRPAPQGAGRERVRRRRGREAAHRRPLRVQARPDREGRRGVYREVLDIDASNLLAMRGLERVYRRRTSGPDLVRVLEMTARRGHHGARAHRRADEDRRPSRRRSS